MTSLAKIRKAQEEGSYQATATLIDLDVDQTKPIDVFSLIQDKGVWLVFGPMGNAFGMYLHEDVPGIFINSRRPPSVQRLTAAHEFGHACLKHRGSIDEKEDIDGASIKDEQEAAAQAFALDFLMPETLVETFWDSLSLPARKELTPRQVYILALEIGISYRACVVQLRQMDKIDKDQAINFLKWQPKQLKAQIGGGMGPADPWADVWPLEDSDNGRAIHIRVNDELRLKLPEAPSTGYRWYRIDSAEEALLPIGDEFERLGGDEPLATGGHRFLSYRATQPKGERLALVLQREWEIPEFIREFSIDCIVDPGPAGPDGIGLPDALKSRYLAQGMRL